MYVAHLECPKCQATYDSEQIIQTGSGLKYPETVVSHPVVLGPKDRIALS
jgi:hypothetical protein